MSGEVEDSSGNGLDGTAVNGATTTSNGQVCGAANFTATTHGVEVPDNVLLDMEGDPFAVAFWYRMRTSSSSAWDQVFVKGNGSRRNYAMWLRPSSSRLHFRVDPSNQGFDSAGSLTLDKWHFITGLYEDGLLQLYIDGVLG